MTRLQELKEKQAKELQTLQIEENVKKLLGDESIKMFASTGYKNDTTIFIDLLKVKVSEITPIIKNIIDKFPPSLDSKEIDYNGKIKHCSPFLLSTQSNIKSDDVIILTYSSSYDIRISLPTKFYSDDILGYHNRKATDSEYHYFGGVSMAEIRRMTILIRSFDMFETLKYYGGSTTCIIKSLEDTENYNFMAINGHVEQFGDFWERQKEQL